MEFWVLVWAPQKVLMKHLTHKKQRALGLFNLEKRRFRGWILSMCINGWGEERQQRLTLLSGGQGKEEGQWAQTEI